MSKFPQPDQMLVEEEKAFAAYADRLKLLFAERNRVYQSQFRKEGVAAILGWIRTKVQRIVIGLDGKIVDDESLSENFLDLAAYGVMGAMLADDDTPKKDCSHLLAVVEPEIAICIVCGVSLKISVVGPSGS